MQGEQVVIEPREAGAAGNWWGGALGWEASLPCAQKDLVLDFITVQIMSIGDWSLRGWVLSKHSVRSSVCPEVLAGLDERVGQSCSVVLFLIILHPLFPFSLCSNIFKNKWEHKTTLCVVISMKPKTWRLLSWKISSVAVIGSPVVVSCMDWK